MIKTIVFDLYGTLFDVESVKHKFEKQFPGNGDKIAKNWRQKLIEYIHIRQLVQQYKPFSLVLSDSLEYVLERNGYDYSLNDIKSGVEEYKRLDTFNELNELFGSIREYRKVIFSNGNRNMIHTLLHHAEMENEFDDIVSLEEFGVYKPDSNSYKLLQEKLKQNQEEVLFVSSNKWEIIGAQNYGYKTAWINRNFSEFEYIDVKPDYEFQTLYGLKTILKA